MCNGLKNIIKMENSLSSYSSYRIAFEYVKSDYYRYYGKISIIGIIFHALTAYNHCFSFNFWFRMAKVKGIFYPIAKFIHYRLVRKFGIQIPIKTKIGYGFYIGHGIGIIINPTAIIGDNVNISQFTTIGAHGQAAIIGNNVYIGPSVCIVNNIKIGNNVAIGAGSVVVKDIDDLATIAGVPAKVLNYNGSKQYVNRIYISKNL